MIKISKGVQFVVDGDCVLVKCKGSLSKLSGPDVRQVLIPLLPELERGFDPEENPRLKSLDSQKTRKVLGQLLEATFLSFCEQSEKVRENKKLTEISNDHVTLGVFGSDRLYKELVATFTSSYPSAEIRKIELEELEQSSECSIVILVNHGMSDASTLTVAKQLYFAGVSFINITINEDEVQVGPYVTKGTGCLHCYNSRRLSNLTFAHEARQFSIASKVYVSEETSDLTESEAKFICGIIEKQCVAIVKAKGLFQSPLQERIVSFNLSTLEITAEEFFRNPRCPVCARDSREITEVKQWSVNPFSKEARP